MAADNIATPDEAAPHIARIDRLTEASRVNWFGLMAYLVFAFITVLGVEDADFFIPARQTDLPLVGVQIPTEAFFYFAPVLGVALYVYLHLYVRKATGALTAAPARILRNGTAPAVDADPANGPQPAATDPPARDDSEDPARPTAPQTEAADAAGSTPLEQHLKLWLLNDMVLRWRGDGAIDQKPFDWLATMTVILLVWCAGPFVLLWTWIRSWPAHDFWMTTFTGLSLTLALYVGHLSWVRLWRDLRHEVGRSGNGDRLRTAIIGVVLLVVIGLGGVKSKFGIIPDPADTPWRDLRTELTDDWRDWWKTGEFSLANLADLAGESVRGTWPVLVSPQWFTHLSSARLAEVRFAALPPDQADPTAARHRFREAWCDRHGMDARTCGRTPVPGSQPIPAQAELRQPWCDERGYDDCAAQFETLEAEFVAEWQANRRALLDALDKPDLRNADLRGADLSNASLTGLVLRGARLQLADLSHARLEGVDLSGAQLRDASMDGVEAPRAVFQRADLSGAMLSGAQLQSAILGPDPGDDIPTLLIGADLRNADLEGANLRMAKLTSAWLTAANMDGVNLFDAVLVDAAMEGASLRDADLHAADLTGAYLRLANLQGAELYNATLRSVTLTQANLDGANLGAAELQGSDLRHASFRNVTWRSRVLDDRRPMNFASDASSADFRGGRGLTQNDLRTLVGDPWTLLPETLSSGQEPYICTCWNEKPPGYEHLSNLLTDPRLNQQPSWRDVFCPWNMSPRRTGTPWPADAAPPWGVLRSHDGTWIDRRAAEDELRRRRNEWSEPLTEYCPPEPWSDNPSFSPEAMRLPPNLGPEREGGVIRLDHGP